MHIFLTGDFQVGKSTALRRTLENFPALRPGGFRTVTVADSPGAMGSVYILPAGETAPETGDFCRVGIRYGPPRGAERFPAVFDSRGVELLTAEEGTRLIVMDEIGFMEAAAPAFSARVRALLDGDTPIFGVLRQQGDTPLQCAIREHPRVRLIRVTPENRDALPEQLSDMLRRALNRRVDSAGVIALRRRGTETQVLMVRCGPGWAFPKGHIEPGETPRQAALRELREETGLAGALYPDFAAETGSGLADERRRITYFAGRIVGGTMTPQLEEVAGCAWQPAERCAALLRFPQDISPWEAARAFLQGK